MINEMDLIQRLFCFCVDMQKHVASNITHTDTPKPDTVRCMSDSEDYLTELV